MAPTISEQQYGPTAGTVSGWIGLVLSVVVGVGVLFSGYDRESLRIALGAALAAGLIWTVMLRPRIIVRLPGTLLLRNPLSTWEIPLAVVEVVSVRAITRVAVGERTYDGVAVGRPIRPPRTSVIGGLSGLGGRRMPAPEGTTKKSSIQASASTPNAIADLMTEQILAAADRARETRQPAEGIRRHWAVPELAVIGAALIGLVVALLS